MDFPARVPAAVAPPPALAAALGRGPEAVLAATHYLAVYPDAAVMARLFPEIMPSQELERLRTRLWNRIKSGS